MNIRTLLRLYLQSKNAVFLSLAKGRKKESDLICVLHRPKKKRKEKKKGTCLSEAERTSRVCVCV